MKLWWGVLWCAGLAAQSVTAAVGPVVTIDSEVQVMIGETAPVGFVASAAGAGAEAGAGAGAELGLLAVMADGTVLSVAEGRDAEAVCRGSQDEGIAGLSLWPSADGGGGLAVAAIGPGRAGDHMRAFNLSSCQNVLPFPAGMGKIPSTEQLATAGFSALDVDGGLGPLASSTAARSVVVSTRGALAGDALTTRRLAVFNASTGELTRVFRYDVESPAHLLRAMVDFTQPGASALTLLVSEQADVLASQYFVTLNASLAVPAADAATANMTALRSVEKEELISFAADFCLPAASASRDTLYLLVGNETAADETANVTAYLFALSVDAAPTPGPTAAPTAAPTGSPVPAGQGSTPAPSRSPTASPTVFPTAAPTAAPTVFPTAAPTVSPTAAESEGGHARGVLIVLVVGLALGACYVCVAKRRRGRGVYRSADDGVDVGEFEMMDLPHSDTFVGQAQEGAGERGERGGNAHAQQRHGTHSQFLIGGNANADADIAII